MAEKLDQSCANDKNSLRLLKMIVIFRSVHVETILLCTLVPKPYGHLHCYWRKLRWSNVHE